MQRFPRICRLFFPFYKIIFPIPESPHRRSHLGEASFRRRRGLTVRSAGPAPARRREPRRALTSRRAPRAAPSQNKFKKEGWGVCEDEVYSGVCEDVAQEGPEFNSCSLTHPNKVCTKYSVHTAGPCFLPVFSVNKYQLFLNGRHG